jgi:S-adenosylmethionine decarboxylase
MNDNQKIKLHGFNNLTKNLSFSFYKISYLVNLDHKRQYNDHINKLYNASQLAILLADICHAVGGNILNIAQQDYQPQGASVTLMISEEARPESLVAHLDKSHICIHTYPEDNPLNNIAIFRADIELSTCGVISPLKVLNYLLEEFDADVIDIDYRVRGMTRDSQGIKKFNDQEVNNISDYISESLLLKYQYHNRNLVLNNLFFSKLCRKEINLNNNLFLLTQVELPATKRKVIIKQIDKELQQLCTNYH